MGLGALFCLLLLSTSMDAMDKIVGFQNNDLENKFQDATRVSGVHAAAPIHAAGVSSPVLDHCNSDSSHNLVGRNSVFSRSNDGSSFSKSAGGLSFADVVGGIGNPKLEFFPLENKEDACIKLPVDFTVKASKSFNSTLFGYFLGSVCIFQL